MLEIPAMVSAGWLPFMVTQIDKRHMSTQRVVEALIIAAVSAGVTAFVTVKQMETKMENINASIARMEIAINGAIVTIDRRRELRDAQLDAIKADITKLKVDVEKRR